MVRKFAERNWSRFQGKNHRDTQNQGVQQFFCRIGLIHLVGTHAAQKNHVETELESCKFMEFITQKAWKYDSKLSLLNMEQTFLLHFIQTICGPKKGCTKVTSMPQHQAQNGQC